MYPVHDVDAILLLSLALAAKRRPADLLEIVTAIDLAQASMPPASKLADGFARLSAYGLILDVNGGYTLSADAQQMMTRQRKKDDQAQRIYQLKEQLADYHLQGEHATLRVAPNDIQTAMDAHLQAKKANRRSLLLPQTPAQIALKKQPFNPLYSRKGRR